MAQPRSTNVPTVRDLVQRPVTQMLCSSSCKDHLSSFSEELRKSLELERVRRHARRDEEVRKVEQAMTVEAPERRTAYALHVAESYLHQSSNMRAGTSMHLARLASTAAQKSPSGADAHIMSIVHASAALNPDVGRRLCNALEYERRRANLYERALRKAKVSVPRLSERDRFGEHSTQMYEAFVQVVLGSMSSRA